MTKPFVLFGEQSPRGIRGLGALPFVLGALLLSLPLRSRGTSLPFRQISRFFGGQEPNTCRRIDQSEALTVTLQLQSQNLAE